MLFIPPWEDIVALDTPPVALESPVSDLKEEQVTIPIYEIPELRTQISDKIIWCESRGKPYAKNINKDGTIDYSYWQINDYFWGDEMLRMGWDITVPEDNLEAGYYLLDTYGTGLWSASEFCWRD